MTSWSVFFITRQRSGMIGRSPSSVVPNWFVTASFTQYHQRTGIGSSRCFCSMMFCTDCSETFGVIRSCASGSPEAVTNVKTRKLATMRTTALESSLRTM